MIITKFNSYFDKHGKATYFVLCIIISVIFVFTFGSADSGCSGNGGRLGSIGSMYGRSLDTDVVLRKCSQIRMLAALNNTRMPNRDNSYEMIQMALQKMRLVHQGAELKLDNVTTEEMVDAVIKLPYWKISDKDHSGNEFDSTDTYYSQTRFTTFINNVAKPQFGLTGEDFDEMMRDEIIANRVQEYTVKDLKADEAAVNLIASDSTVSTFEIPLQLENDSRPSEDEIKDYLEKRSSELTDKDRMTVYYLIAYATSADLEATAKKKPEIAKALEVTDDEVTKFFAAHENDIFQGKKAEDVKEQITKQLKADKATAWTTEQLKSVSAALATAIPAGSNRYTQIKKAASAANLKIVGQNGVPEGSFVNGIEMQQQNLVNAIKGLNTVDQASGIIPLNGENGEDGAAIAIRVDNPDKDSNIRSAVIRNIRGEKALAMYKEKVEKPYAAKLAAAASLDAFYAAEGGAKLNLTDPAVSVPVIQKRNELSALVGPFAREVEGKLVLEAPDAKDVELINWYKRQVAREAALKRANEKLAQVKADAKLVETFKANDKKLNWYSVINTASQFMFQQMYMSQGRVTPEMMNELQFYSVGMAANTMKIPVNNFADVVMELSKAPANTLIDKVFEGNRGFVLVYQKERALPADENGKTQVDNTRDMLLNRMKQEALSKLNADLEAASATRLVEGIEPSSEQAAK